MKDVSEDVDAWVARGDAVALATVVDVKRSAPRPPGAKMAINDRGDVGGAVSGGCVEGAVVEAAQEGPGGAPPRLVTYGILDEEAWDVGLPCGGEITVWIQADPDERFAALARPGGRGRGLRGARPRGRPRRARHRSRDRRALARRARRRAAGGAGAGAGRR